jgi:threonine/homoserine/homoserine lactone efflux protein
MPGRWQARGRSRLLNAGKRRELVLRHVCGTADAGTPSRACAVAFTLAALNPKNVALALAAASVIGQVDQEWQGAVIEAVIFVGLASTTVVSVVLVNQFSGPGGTRSLDGLRQRLLRHNEDCRSGADAHRRHHPRRRTDRAWLAEAQCVA